MRNNNAIPAPSDAEMAIHYQIQARHYATWQYIYMNTDDLDMAIMRQQDAAIAAETAMDYLQCLLSKELS